MRFKNPPYSRALREILEKPDSWRSYAGTSCDGSRLQIWIAAGADAWQWAIARQKDYAFLMAPYAQAPDLFDWSMLAGHDPILLMPCGALGALELRAIAEAVLRDGTRRLLVWGRSDYFLRGYRKARELAVDEGQS